jgi:hypothetical protein
MPLSGAPMISLSTSDGGIKALRGGLLLCEGATSLTTGLNWLEERARPSPRLTSLLSAFFLHDLDHFWRLCVAALVDISFSNYLPGAPDRIVSSVPAGS